MNYVYHVQKTKPTQHSVRGLRCMGLTPHILACRSTTVVLSLSLSLTRTSWHIYARTSTYTRIFTSSCRFKIFHMQALDENVKVKLSQFCHVPVCGWKDKTTYAEYFKIFIYQLCKRVLNWNCNFSEREHYHSVWRSQHLAHSFALKGKLFPRNFWNLPIWFHLLFLAAITCKWLFPCILVFFF